MVINSKQAHEVVRENKNLIENDRGGQLKRPTVHVK